MTRQDRFILQSTAEVMNSALRHIDSIVNWMVGDGSLSYGEVTVPGSVNEPRRCKPELAEVDRFLEMYGFFRDRVIGYDDSRMDNEEKA